MSITVYETAILTGESFGQVEFTYTEEPPTNDYTDWVSIKFYPESKQGYQSIAIDNRLTLSSTERMVDRKCARKIWNQLIDMGFHL